MAEKHHTDGTALRLAAEEPDSAVHSVQQVEQTSVSQEASKINTSHGVSHHGHSHDWAEANKHYFDNQALKYDDPVKTELARRAAKAIMAVYPFDEESTVVMDYACGTGLLSKELAPYTKCIVGIDLSQVMVDLYNESVSNHGIPEEEMKAICTELKGEENELNGQKFDVIVCAMAYHHFASIERVTRILLSFLNPEGALFITDLMKAENLDPLFDGRRDIVAHTGGFAEDEIRKVFTDAGLVEFSYKKLMSLKHGGTPVNIFLAKGVKLSVSEE